MGAAREKYTAVADHDGRRKRMRKRTVVEGVGAILVARTMTQQQVQVEFERRNCHGATFIEGAPISLGNSRLAFAFLHR